MKDNFKSSLIFFALINFSLANYSRSTTYIGYTSINPNGIVEFKNMKNAPILYNSNGDYHYYKEEFNLVPYHLLRLAPYESNFTENYNYIYEGGTTECSSVTDINVSNICKLIPYTFNSDHSILKKHYVIWINYGSCIGIIPRVRNFEDIGEARNFYKKVYDIKDKVVNRGFAVLLVSKEGSNILQYRNNKVLDTWFNYLIGKEGKQGDESNCFTS